MNEQNAVNEAQEQIVDAQTEPTVNEPVNAGNAEPAEPQTVEKPIQTPEQNAEYAKIRRESEARARDATIAELGYEYNGKPIKTYAEYQQALKESETAKQNAEFEEQNGFSPDSIKPLFEQWKQSDPDFQELKSIRAEKNTTKALSDLNKELEDAGLDLKLADLSDTELQKIPNVDRVTEYVTKGHSLADAFFLANKKDIISGQVQKVQQETIKKIAANGESSPGSLSGGGEDSFFTREQVDGMSMDQVMKNYDAIMKSQKKWK